jgi:hypothetical protein
MMFRAGARILWFTWAFVAAPAAASELDIAINEVHYHPFGKGDPDLEFVELFNRGLRPVDLSGWKFSEGIAFVFPPGVILDPGDYLVVSPNGAALRSLYPSITVVGNSSGKLDNKGEVLLLQNARGAPISRVHYKDSGAWSSLPDGSGPSLELLLPDGDIDRPQVWAPSLYFGGTPGAPNSRGKADFPYLGKEKRPLLRINEVKPAAGPADAGFLELWNGGEASIDISGYKLLSVFGQTFTFPAGSAAGPGFLLVTAGELGFSPVQEAGTYVLIGRDGRTWIDALEARPMPSGRGFGRFPDGDGDGFVIQPSGGKENAHEPEQRVVINEVFFAPRFERPSGACTRDCADPHQWIELHSRAAEPVDLSGWSLDEGVTFTFPAGTAIPPAGYLVCAASLQAFQADHPGVLAVGDWKGSLGHREDTIVLRDALGNSVEHIHYGNGNPFNDVAPEDGVDDQTFTSSDWPAGVSNSGRSIELVSPGLKSSAGRSWKLGPLSGTPLAQNAAFDPDPPPVVKGVVHSPAVPLSSDPVTVTCRVYSASSLLSVEVVWRLDGSVNTSRVSMKDDGSSGDGRAGDEVYGARLPPQANGSIVAFQVEAASGTGKAAVFPPKPLRGASPSYLYEVDDEPLLDNRSVHYRVIMARADLDALKARSVQSNVLLHGTFIGDGEVHHLAGIRYRGENSRNLPRKAYRIEFPPEDSFEGIEILNLNASNDVGGVEATSLRDFLSADLFRRAGWPYVEEWPVNLYFRGGVRGDLQGQADVDPFYIRKEHFNRDFLSRYFGGSDHGNLYRALDPGGAGSGDLSYLGQDPNAYAPFYEKHSNRDENDYSDLIELVRAFDPGQTPDAVFEGEMLRLLDVNEWAAFFAIQDFLTNIDGAIQTNNGEDYFLYHVPEDSSRRDRGKWLILPWDLEETFANAGDGLFLTQVAAARRFLRQPSFAALYLSNLKELQKGPASRPEMTGRYAYAREIYPPDTVASVINPIDNYLLRRLALVDDQIISRIDAGINAGQTPGTQLILEGDSWKYFKGTREPDGTGLDWTLDGYADGAWATGASGFGYGDNDDATALDDMRGAYVSLYVRKSFRLDDLARITGMKLVIDYDDAFVAYLNGGEVARSGDLAGVGQTGKPIPFDFELGNAVNHEASRGDNNPSPIETHVLANWRALLREGTNVLAIHGLNAYLDSRDFSLIPTLVAAEGPAATSGGWGDDIFTTGATVTLQGRADATAARSLKVGGALATITGRPPSGGPPYGLSWRASVPLVPGPNTVPIEAFAAADGTGEVTGSARVTVYQLEKGFKQAGGSISESVTWKKSDGPYLLSSNVVISPGASLSIEPGTQVLFRSGVFLTADGTLDASGTVEEPILFRPFELNSRWGGIVLGRTGTAEADPTQKLRYIDLELAGAPAGICVSARGTKLLVEGSKFRLLQGTALDARDCRLEARNCLFQDIQAGVRGVSSVVTITGSLFSGIAGDNSAIDLSGSPSERSRIEGCVIERSARNGLVVTGVGADIFENTLRFIADRGCFLRGDSLLGPTLLVGNVIHDCGTGVEVSGGLAVANGHHDTVASSAVGMRWAGPDQGADEARASFHSMILWRDGEILDFQGRISLALAYSDVGSAILWPGERNIRANPLFRDVLGGDFSLTPGSPCAGAGKDGTDMGATGARASGPVFLRGDTNEDGLVNLTDAVVILSFLFRGAGPLACQDAADTEDNGQVNLTDAVYLLNHLFRGGPSIAPPYPEPGRDTTGDELECR